MHRIEIEWDEDSVDHIGLHQVELVEVEEMLSSFHLWQRGRMGRYCALGQTRAGRHLFVVLSRKRSGSYRCVTARPMTDSERRRYGRLKKR